MSKMQLWLFTTKALVLFTKNWNHIQIGESLVDSAIYHDFWDSNIFHPLFGLESQSMLLSDLFFLNWFLRSMFILRQSSWDQWSGGVQTTNCSNYLWRGLLSMRQIRKGKIVYYLLYCDQIYHWGLLISSKGKTGGCSTYSCLWFSFRMKKGWKKWKYPAEMFVTIELT